MEDRSRGQSNASSRSRAESADDGVNPALRAACTSSGKNSGGLGLGPPPPPQQQQHHYLGGQLDVLSSRANAASAAPLSAEDPQQSADLAALLESHSVAMERVVQRGQQQVLEALGKHFHQLHVQLTREIPQLSCQMLDHVEQHLRDSFQAEARGLAAAAVPPRQAQAVDWKPSPLERPRSPGNASVSQPEKAMGPIAEQTVIPLARGGSAIEAAPSVSPRLGGQPLKRPDGSIREAGPICSYPHVTSTLSHLSLGPRSDARAEPGIAEAATGDASASSASPEVPEPQQKTRVHMHSQQSYKNNLSSFAADVAEFSEDARDFRLKDYRSREMLLGKLKKTFADEPVRSGPAACIVQHICFERLCLFIIFLNTIWTMFTTNRRAGAADGLVPLDFQLRATTVMFLENLFVWWYFFEVAMKIWVHRCFYFFTPDWCWNLFDLVVVVWSGLEWGLQKAGDMDGVLDMRFLRMLKVLKVSKILRIFRAFRFLFELRLMVSCVLGSLVPLMWAAVLLLLVLMIFSLIFVECMIQYQIDSPNVTFAEREEIQTYFGSIGLTMVTLFQCTTGGEDWAPMFNLVSNAGGLYSVLFLFFITFFVFAFFNIVTSIFVDKAMNLAQHDIEFIRLQRTHDEMFIARELRIMIQSFDKDGSGTISRSELQGIAEDERLKHRFEVYDLNIRDADHLFTTVSDLVGVDELDIDTFVAGWMKMKGWATSIDQQTIILLVYRLTDIVNCIAAEMKVDPTQHLSIFDKRRQRTQRQQKVASDASNTSGGGT